VRGRKLPVLDHLVRSRGGGKYGLRAVAGILSKAGPIYQGLILGLNSAPARIPVGQREVMAFCRV
jgi:hypothetical protein